MTGLVTTRENNLTSTRAISQTRWNRIANSCGLLGLMLVALGLASSKAAQNFGMLLMLVGIVLSGRQVWDRFWRDPLCWLCLGWIGYVLFSAWIFSAQTPAYAAAHWDHAGEMLRLAYIPLAAWWFAADSQRIRISLLLVLIGLLLAVFINADWNHLLSMLIQGVAPNRSGFGMNEQHFGLLCVLALAGFGVFYIEWIGTGSHTQRLLRALLLAVTGLLVLTALVITQARTTWLAFALLLGLAAVAGAASWVRGRRRGLWEGAGLLIAAVLVSSFVYVQWSAVEQRMAPELQVIADYLREGKAPDYESSMFVRFRLWSIAQDGIIARPLFGWGPAGEKRLIAEAVGEPSYVREFGHVHNSYLGLAVRSGAIGLAIVAAVVILIGQATLQARRRRCLDDRLALYLVIVLGIFLFANLTESYLDRQLGWFIAAFFGGAGYSFSLHVRKADTD